MWQEILHLDQQVLLALNGSWGCFWDWFWYIVTAPFTWMPMYAIIIFYAWKRWGWKQTLFLILYTGIAIGLADQVSNLFKYYTPKFRPTHNPDIQHMVHRVNNYVGGLYGTVSGHASTSFAIATVLSGAFRKRWFTVWMYSWAILVAYSRIYLGVHFPLDILFGTIAGLLIGWLCLWQYRKVKV